MSSLRTLAVTTAAVALTLSAGLLSVAAAQPSPPAGGTPDVTDPYRVPRRRRRAARAVRRGGRRRRTDPAGALRHLHLGSGAGSASGTTPAGDFQIGEPGIGQAAPDIALASTTGDQVRLADFRGSSVLLYFREGLGCQPCWDQLRDLEARRTDLTAAGIDEIVTVTTDPIDLLTHKVTDEGLDTPVLSDPDLEVSRQYETNNFGMMGDSRNGHTLLLVDPQGTITWRADYGGAPKYTMFVPIDRLLADLQAATA